MTAGRLCFSECLSPGCLWESQEDSGMARTLAVPPAASAASRDRGSLIEAEDRGLSFHVD